MSDQLLRTIERVQSEIRQGANLNERQTINYLISPILNSLGWNVYDRTRVIHEFPVGNGQVDMAFKHDDKTVAFLEAKRVGVDLGVQELKQLGGVLFRPWCTNGHTEQWRGMECIQAAAHHNADEGSSADLCRFETKKCSGDRERTVSVGFQIDRPAGS